MPCSSGQLARQHICARQSFPAPNKVDLYRKPDVYRLVLKGMYKLLNWHISIEEYITPCVQTVDTRARFCFFFSNGPASVLEGRSVRFSGVPGTIALVATRLPWMSEVGAWSHLQLLGTCTDNLMHDAWTFPLFFPLTNACMYLFFSLTNPSICWIHPIKPRANLLISCSLSTQGLTKWQHFDCLIGRLK